MNVELPKCIACNIRHFGLCQAMGQGGLGVVASFKSGDRHFAAGDHLYHEGDVVREAYNLLDGWVLLYHMLEDGRRQILEILLPGAFFGFRPDPVAAMSHSAVAATAGKLCVFPKQGLVDLFHEHSALSLRLMQMNAADRRALHGRLISLGRRDARHRIVHLLVELDTAMQTLEPESASAIPLTQAQLGDALGLSEVHVNRVLHELSDEGLVALRRGNILVRERHGLARIAGDYTGADERANAHKRANNNSRG